MTCRFTLIFFVGSVRNFLEVEFQFDAQVRPAPNPLPLPSAPAVAPVEKRAKRGVVAKNIAKLTENIVHRRAARPVAATTGRPCHTGMAKLVVTSLFLRVAQGIVGFGGLFKLIFGGGVVGVFVGVILDGHFAVSLLDIIRRCRLVDA